MEAPSVVRKDVLLRVQRLLPRASAETLLEVDRALRNASSPEWVHPEGGVSATIFHPPNESPRLSFNAPPTARPDVSYFGVQTNDR